MSSSRADRPRPRHPIEVMSRPKEAPVNNIIRKLREALSKAEEGQAYAYGGGGLLVTVLIVVVIVLLLR